MGATACWGSATLVKSGTCLLAQLDGARLDDAVELTLESASGTTFSDERVGFVTAFDRASTAFRKTVGSLAWQTLVWLAWEPDYVVILGDAADLEERRVVDLLRYDD